MSMNIVGAHPKSNAKIKPIRDSNCLSTSYISLLSTLQGYSDQNQNQSTPERRRYEDGTKGEKDKKQESKRLLKANALSPAVNDIALSWVNGLPRGWATGIRRGVNHSVHAHYVVVWVNRRITHSVAIRLLVRSHVHPLVLLHVGWELLHGHSVPVLHHVGLEYIV